MAILTPGEELSRVTYPTHAGRPGLRRDPAFLTCDDYRVAVSLRFSCAWMRDFT